MSTKKPAAKKVPAKKAIIVKKPAAPAAAAKPAAAPATAKAATGLCLEMLTAAGIKLDPKVAFPAFAASLCESLAAIDDAVFNKLSKPAQEWFNAAGDVINKGEPEYSKPGALPALEGYPGVVAVNTTQAVANAAAAKPAKAPKAPKAPKEAKPPKEKAPSAVAGARMNPNGVTFRMFEAVVTAGPEITFADACKAAGVKGEAAEQGGHAWNKYHNARQVLLVAKGLKAYKQPAVAA